MKRWAINAAFGLTAATILAVATPAWATKLRNYQDPNMCLAMNSRDNVAMIWPCNGVGEIWAFDNVRNPVGAVVIWELNSGKTLNRESESSLHVVLSRAGNAWQTIPHPANPACYYFTHLYTGVVLGVAGARNGQALQQGTAVITWAATGEDNQFWCPDWSSD